MICKYFMPFRELPFYLIMSFNTLKLFWWSFVYFFSHCLGLWSKNTLPTNQCCESTPTFYFKSFISVALMFSILSLLSLSLSFPPPQVPIYAVVPITFRRLALGPACVPKFTNAHGPYIKWHSISNAIYFLLCTMNHP